MKKKGFTLFFSALLIAAIGAMLWQLNFNQAVTVSAGGTLTPVQEDANQLVSIIESTHPEFSLNDIQPGYPTAKKSFLAAASKKISYDDFAWLASAYLASLRDGHTSIFQTQSNETLQGSYRMTESGLFEVDSGGSITDKKVTAIGGIPIDQIFTTISRYEVAENEAGVMMNDTTWSTYRPILELAGVDCTKSTVSITEQNGTQTSSKEVAFQSRSPNSEHGANNIVDSSRIGDIFYIGLHECELKPDVEWTAATLRQMAADGVTRVIIDVRNNPGGNSKACERLLNAMGMRVPEYGVYARKSPLAVAQCNGTVDWNTKIQPSQSTAQTNSHISLVVLTNEFTFSSATMLAVWVQDGKLGTVIGYPSANSPSSYGDVLSFQLKNSGIKGTVSYKRWLRPNAQADQRMLHPDVLVPIRGDALKTAINFLDRKCK